MPVKSNNEMSIGSRVRAERERQNISRPTLAKAAGIAVSTLSDLELGRSAGTTALHRIAKHLGVRVEYLETGSGSPRLNDSPKADRSEQDSQDERDFRSRTAIPDPAILHRAVTLLLYDLDHGPPRSANTATSLLLSLYQRIASGEWTDDDERAFEADARSRGEKAGVNQDERSRKRGR